MASLSASLSPNPAVLHETARHVPAHPHALNAQGHWIFAAVKTRVDSGYAHAQSIDSGAAAPV
jgi:hypothetical protein